MTKVAFVGDRDVLAAAALHMSTPGRPMMRCFGGREIAAKFSPDGAFAEAAIDRVTVYGTCLASASMGNRKVLITQSLDDAIFPGHLHSVRAGG